MATLKIPTKPAERRVWILYQLTLKGESFASLARGLGCSTTAVWQVADGKRSDRIGAAIAAAIGVAQARLFPEHFDDRGNRLPVTTRNRQQATPPSARRTVESAAQI